MDIQQYDAVCLELNKLADEIEQSKRPAYTIGDTDILANFKRTAERTGTSPMQVWAVFFLKHIDALTSLAKDPDLPQAECVKGRFADARNYIKLGYALYSEQPKKV